MTSEHQVRRDYHGYLLRCIGHHRLTCPECEQEGAYFWERAVPGCNLIGNDAEAKAAKLEGFSTPAEWQNAGRLRALWLRDLKYVLKYVLLSGDFGDPYERVNALILEAEVFKK